MTLLERMTVFILTARLEPNKKTAQKTNDKKGRTFSLEGVNLYTRHMELWSCRVNQAFVSVRLAHVAVSSREIVVKLQPAVGRHRAYPLKKNRKENR